MSNTTKFDMSKFEELEKTLSSLSSKGALVVAQQYGHLNYGPGIVKLVDTAQTLLSDIKLKFLESRCNKAMIALEERLKETSKNKSEEVPEEYLDSEEDLKTQFEAFETIACNAEKDFESLKKKVDQNSSHIQRLTDQMKQVSERLEILCKKLHKLHVVKNKN